MKKEQWLDVPEWEGWYQVSDKGRVRSLPRISACGRDSACYKGKVLKGTLGTNGYAVVCLTAPGVVKQYKYVHRLVTEAFLGPCVHPLEVCHNNGKRSDNRLKNLRYDTRRNNALDRRKHGTTSDGSQSRGEKSGTAKLTEEAVKIIRARTDLTLKVLAEMFGVNLGTVHCVRVRKTWRHI